MSVTLDHNDEVRVTLMCVEREGDVGIRLSFGKQAFGLLFSRWLIVELDAGDCEPEVLVGPIAGQVVLVGDLEAGVGDVVLGDSQTRRVAARLRRGPFEVPSIQVILSCHIGSGGPGDIIFT